MYVPCRHCLSTGRQQDGSMLFTRASPPKGHTQNALLLKADESTRPHSHFRLAGSRDLILRTKNQVATKTNPKQTFTTEQKSQIQHLNPKLTKKDLLFSHRIRSTHHKSARVDRHQFESSAGCKIDDFLLRGEGVLGAAVTRTDEGWGREAVSNACTLQPIFDGDRKRR